MINRAILSNDNGIVAMHLESDEDEITYIEYPETGKSYRQGEVFATVETSKQVFELTMDFNGKCVGVDEDARVIRWEVKKC